MNSNIYLRAHERIITNPIRITSKIFKRRIQQKVDCNTKKPLKKWRIMEL